MLTIGSRGSQLALWQAHWVRDRLAELGETAVIEIIKTSGDRIVDAPLAAIGGKGLFTKEIEDALLEGRIDLAVHSLKDLPTELPAGLAIAAVPPREDVHDAMVGGRLQDLPPRARVGTSSLRRTAQLRAARPDLTIEPVRGNLDTRLRKLSQGQYDALALAAAGLRRLGWEDRIAELLPFEVMCPAVGQGALAIETRQEGAAAQTCARLNHLETRLAVETERAVLRALGGGCQVPIGAHAAVEGGALRLIGVVASPDGARLIRREAVGSVDDAAALARGLSEELIGGGAGEILEEVYGS